MARRAEESGESSSRAKVGGREMCGAVVEWRVQKEDGWRCAAPASCLCHYTRTLERVGDDGANQRGASAGESICMYPGWACICMAVVGRSVRHMHLPEILRRAPKIQGGRAGGYVFVHT